MKTEDLVTVRPFNGSDKNFIYKTWLRGLFYGNWMFREVQEKTFYTNYQAILDELLLLPGVDINVACLAEDDDVVLGYCVSQENALHWVYVKKSWRKIGIAKMLVDFPVEKITHITEVGRVLKLKYSFKFDPFRL